MKLSCLLLGLSFLTSVAAESPNLIRDGDFAEVPPLKTVTPPPEHHANADYWRQPVIPGWELGGKAFFVEVKQPPLRGLDIQSGSAAQTIATVPGNSYRLTFHCFMNGGGRCRLEVNFGGQVTTHTVVSPGGNFETTFVARSDQTRVVFKGLSDPGGPRIAQVRCTGYDATARKLMDQLVSSYQLLDKGEKSASDLSAMLAHLSPDFAWTPLQGGQRDRSGYEDLVRLRMDKKFKVYTELQDAKALTDGSIEVEVERRESQNGEYGKLETTTSRWRHTWVRDGSGWLIKAAQEQE